MPPFFAYPASNRTWPRPPAKGKPSVRPYLARVSSPYLDWPPWTKPLIPVYVVSSLKLMTPATASDPYTAEAPPVTTSMPLMRPCGNVLRSTSPEVVEPTTRCPFSMISVRSEPRALRLAVLSPLSPLLMSFLPTVDEYEVTTEGMVTTRSDMLFGLM